MPQEISQRWKASFGSAHPVGFLCRTELQPRWLRIHSLPLSKRYPDNDNERTELVRRHLEVAAALLGEQASCTLFLRSFGPVDEMNAGLILGFERSDLTHLPELSVIDDHEELHFFATPFPWNEERLKQLILAVADELSGPMFFTNLERGTAYAPYDGGADLFFSSRHEVDVARTRWTDWLSDRSDGL